MEQKELKEALKGMLKLTAVLAHEFKDGVQVADIAPILAKLQEEPLKSELIAAYNDIDKVPSEVKELTAIDVLALMAEITPELLGVLKAIQK